VARLEEAVAVIRALWTGGPVTRESPYYPLVEATAFPVPVPPPPIVIGGKTAAGTRLAARIGDGWTAFEDNFEANLPLYLESLATGGRRREDQRVLVLTVWSLMHGTIMLTISGTLPEQDVSKAHATFKSTVRVLVENREKLLQGTSGTTA
jgi:alkanesulfonate monooxygenase SsuD/methylene tetrahydromethanopterin reductase-like flavin-dependent oxidoreductase (luciferase family)